MNQTKDISDLTGADVIDLRDVTDLVESLRDSIEADQDRTLDVGEQDTLAENVADLKALTDLLDELRGNGGDHQWEGDWYPGSMIAAGYFKTYAQELADDIGAVKDDAEWPSRHIDWDAAADELKQDYTSVDFGGSEWYVR